MRRAVRCRGALRNRPQLAAALFRLAQLLMATDRKDEALPLLIMHCTAAIIPKDGTDGLGRLTSRIRRASRS